MIGFCSVAQNSLYVVGHLSLDIKLNVKTIKLEHICLCYKKVFQWTLFLVDCNITKFFSDNFNIVLNIQDLSGCDWGRNNQPN